jgi:hypothetical protein
MIEASFALSTGSLPILPYRRQSRIDSRRAARNAGDESGGLIGRRDQYHMAAALDHLQPIADALEDRNRFGALFPRRPIA